MKRRPENDLRVTQEAADWLARLESTERDGHAAFLDWVRQSPVHVQEFLAVSQLSRRLEDIDPQRRRDVDKLVAQAATTVVNLQDSNLTPTNKAAGAPRLWRQGLAAAAAIAALAVLLLTLGDIGRRHYATGIGEQRVVKLPDGSMIHLNVSSRVAVRFDKSARAIELTAGEALFTVAQEPARPFRVAAGGTVIEALGTQFNVYRRAAGTTVAVVEGRVRVSSGEVLSAGEGVRIDASGGVKRQLASVGQAIAWRQRLLEFRDTPLQDAVTEFNRYNTLQLQIEGDAVRELQVTGFFNADNPQGLLQFLEKDRTLSVVREAERVVIRAR